MVKLKVLTLNCWGIEVPVICKHRHERMNAIGDIMGKGEYDILFFQEVWSNSDYQFLCDKIGISMPYSHYFHSGSIGSGLCIFSKFEIKETLFHRFQINGFPHKIQHGDWFGGKGVGLCQIQVDNFNINLYITHIHAEYNRENDVYISHRVSQAFEMSQFIKHTSQTCDLVLFGGDLNLQTTDLGYKIITSTALLEDTWITKKSTKNEKGFTCDRQENHFTSPSAPDLPNGQRIDYLLYRNNAGNNVIVEECEVLYHQVPGQTYPISDHEAVTATLHLQKTTDTKSSSNQGISDTLTQDGRNEHLTEALEKLDTGMAEIQSGRRFFMALAVISMISLYVITCFDVDWPCGLSPMAAFAKITLILLFGFSVVYGIVIKASEKNSLYSTKLDILNLLGKPIKNDA